VNPESLRYAKTHEWVHVEENAAGEKIATLGISQFAVEALTDLVFIDLPQVGRLVSAGQPLCEIESVKAVSDIYSPVNGEVIDVNKELPDHLEILSDDPYEKGWMVRIRLVDEGGLDQLMDYAVYQAHCEQEDS